jgi:parafibromin
MKSTEGNTGLASRTTMILEGVAGYFDRIQQERKDRNGRLMSPGTPGTLVTPASPGRRAFGLAPWHRRNSHESIISVSSSVHKLLRGKTPAATPVPESQYALGGKEFIKGI